MSMLLRGFLGLAVAASMAVTAGCATAPAGDRPALVTADHVDLQRFMGRWYVIANIPYWGERGYVGSYVEYSLRQDGDIDDLFFGHKRSFDQPLSKTTLKDWVVNTQTNAEWRASPFWPLSFPYLILYVDPDYQTTIIGYPDRSLGWIFSRTPTLSAQALADLNVRLRAQGYDLTQFRLVPQRPEDIGQPGFQ